jgi:hypothetical protein
MDPDNPGGIMSVSVKREHREAVDGSFVEFAMVDIDGDDQPDLTFAVYPGSSDERVQEIAEQLAADYQATGVHLEQVTA